ncbi:MAG: CBS domain-containing protein, partial [Desulfurococcaceae archaeon]|nr:CBS domain-containing protein [Desulfurococcaceae archaeon]
MSRNPITAHYTAKIRDVANLMYENGVGSVMIVDDKGVLVGIVTERD